MLPKYMPFVKSLSTAHNIPINALHFSLLLLVIIVVYISIKLLFCGIGLFVSLIILAGLLILCVLGFPGLVVGLALLFPGLVVGLVVGLALLFPGLVVGLAFFFIGRYFINRRRKS